MADLLYADGGHAMYRVLPARALLEIPHEAWEYNRQVDGDRAARIADAQAANLEEGNGRQAASVMLPTPITFCLQGGKRLLMDGQHRVRALQLLRERGLALDQIDVLVCELTCGTPEDVENAFVRINCGTPVPAEYYSKKVRRVLDDFGDEFVQEFPAAISASLRPQRPNANIGIAKTEMSTHIPLRDAIIDGRVKAKDLMDILRAENSIEEKVAAGKPRGVTPLMLDRAKKSGFFLGLRSGWPIAVAARAAATEG